MRCTAAALAVAVSFLSSVQLAGATGLPAPLAQLQTDISLASQHAPGRVAFEVKDLRSGFTSGYNMNEVMPAASTIKIPIMVEVFKQMQQGRFDLNRRVELFASDKDWGSGDICDDPDGTEIPVSTLLMKMITISDNTAANMLIRLVGRRRINATMHDLGLHHTDLFNSIRTEEYSVRSALVTTPSDMVKILTDMAHRRLIDDWSSNEMIAILEKQQINTLIPEPLPDVPIAHKTGSFDDTLNDVGIVFAPGDPYVIAVMTTNLPSLPAGRAYIHRLSRETYTSFERFFRWRLANQDDSALPLEADASAPSSSDSVPDEPMWGPGSRQ